MILLLGLHFIICSSGGGFTTFSRTSGTICNYGGKRCVIMVCFTCEKFKKTRLPTQKKQLTSYFKGVDFEFSVRICINGSKAHGNGAMGNVR